MTMPSSRISARFATFHVVYFQPAEEKINKLEISAGI
jgi:hypothetical protein